MSDPVYPPCVFCARTDVAPDPRCPWGCRTRNGSPQCPHEYLERGGCVLCGEPRKVQR